MALKQSSTAPPLAAEGISIRVVLPDDRRALSDFRLAVTPDARPLRFFSDASASRLNGYLQTPSDGVDHFGVLAQTSDGRIVAHAAYIRLYGPRAELELELGDNTDRIALATALVRELARVARSRGIRRFVTAGPASNTDVVAQFREGVESPHPNADGWSVIEFPTAPAREAAEGADPLASAGATTPA
jgi:hypothetical protein